MTKADKEEIRKYKCYFAHPFESIGCPEEAEIIKELQLRGVIVVNPFDDEDKIYERYGREVYYPDPPYRMARDVWAKDLQQVYTCDMFLVYVPDGTRLSGGCGYEMAHAYMWHKFIQIISVSRHPAFAYVLTKGNQMFLSIKDWMNNKVLRWD